ncbi:MAG: hypothetical protein ABIK62_04465, partial [candidate division WOR-3 bacterium]
QNLVFQWARVYAGPLDDFGYSIVQTHDGGFAVCGATWGLGAPPWPNVIVLKTDHSGMLQWSKVYWTPMPLLCEEAYGLIQTGAGTPVHPLGYVVVGRMWEDTLARDAFLLRLDMQGNPVLFVNRFTGPFTEEAYSVTQRDSVSYVLAGWTNSWGPGTPAWANIFVSRVMASGPVTWRQVFGWSENDEKVMSDRALISTSDRGFALSGWTGSRGPGVPNTNFLVLKLTPAGQIQWSRVHPSLPGALLEQAYPIVENSQGGFATAGFTSSFGVGGKDFHLLTLNSLGWRPACIDSPAIPADSIPAVPDSMIQYLVPLDSTSFPLEPTSIEVTEVCPLVGVIESGSWPSPTCPLLIAGLRPQLELYVALAGSYQVNLLDCTGRRKAELANRHYPVGRHLLSVPTRLRPGLYYLDIRTEQRHAVRRLIRL